MKSFSVLKKQSNARFTSWFSGSIVTNRSGEPLETYHYSSNINISLRASEMWFSDNKNAFKDSFPQGVLLVAYLSIKTPLDLFEAREEYSLDVWEVILQEAGLDTDKLQFDSGLTEDSNVVFGDLFPNVNNYLSGDSNLLSELKRQGFDGVLAPPETRHLGDSTFLVLNALEQVWIKTKIIL